MIQHPDSQALSPALAEEPAHPRKPFVPPTVQSLGGLKVLTLVGGSL